MENFYEKKNNNTYFSIYLDRKKLVMEDFKDFAHDFGQEYLDENNPDYSIVSMDYVDEFYANHSPC